VVDRSGANDIQPRQLWQPGALALTPRLSLVINLLRYKSKGALGICSAQTFVFIGVK
jgi:hypothetical protein